MSGVTAWCILLPGTEICYEQRELEVSTWRPVMVAALSWLGFVGFREQS
jgi:hypothetical protein